MSIEPAYQPLDELDVDDIPGLSYDSIYARSLTSSIASNSWDGCGDSLSNVSHLLTPSGSSPPAECGNSVLDDYFNDSIAGSRS